MRTVALLLTLSFSSISLIAQAPTNLSAKTATNKSVGLSWSGTASGYSVQRAIVGQAFGTIATVTTTSYIDNTVDAYTTYQYQIVASSGSTTPSNKITVGPPPAGFSNAAPTPGGSGSNAVGNYGYDLAMTLDSNGDPAFTFLWNDPNNDTNPIDTQILFRSWNRAQYAWNPVVTVGVVGDVTSSFQNITSIAYDPSIPAFAIATPFETATTYGVYVFTSTDGAAWTKKATFTETDGAGGAAVALAGGNIYLAYNASDKGVKYYSGKLANAQSTWVLQQPKLSGVTLPDNSTNPSVAVDSAGNPGVAFFASSATSYNQILYFWRPVSGTTVIKASDSQNNGGQTDVKLMFYGTNPRMVFYAQRNDAESGIAVHFIASSDGGNTWATPVVIPPDVGTSTDFPFDMAIGSTGQIAIAFGRNGGTGSDICGNPKISTSTDLVHFKTCAVADMNITGNFDPFPMGIAAAYGGNDGLYLMWTETYDNSTGVGILMYRQPPAGQSTAPSINTDGTGAENGGTNQPGGIVAGSWVAIKGANLSDIVMDWSHEDFSNGLPTTLSGVQVLMNNKPAAMYYLSNAQINVQAPASVPSSGTVSIQVVRNGVASNTINVNASANAPGMFTYTLDAGKTFYPAAVFLDGTLVGDPALYGPAKKVRAGDRILLFVTGMGTAPAGTVINAPIGFSSPVTVKIGSTNITPDFTGLVAPGEWQINVTIPAGIAPGNQTMTVTTNGATSQSGVIIPVTQ
jgi:uncharacterized protein (TIGR03437 family)